MKLKAGSGITLTLILIGILTLAFNIQPVKAEPRTIIVPDDYHTIQEAIDNANERDTIYVKAGTHHEHVVINKTVSLIGENRDTTIIDGNGTGSVVYVIADNVKVSGFTIQNSGPYHGIDAPDAGILVDNSGGNKISRNNIAKNTYGIFLGNSLNNSIFDNNITPNNWGGIELFMSSKNSVYGNKITNNWFGIGFELSSNNTVSGNNITNNGSGVALEEWCSNNIISGNNIANNCPGYGILLYFRPNHNSVYGNNITNNDCGVALEMSWENKFYHNNFINNAAQVDTFANFWDNGYPSGGNYWSDYTAVDNYSGPYQNETGNDRIGDTPYVIRENNQDNYPLVNPRTSENAIRKLIRDVENMNLQQGIDNSLDAKLTATLDALEALNADKRNDAINKLYAFVNEVEAQREKKLTSEQADYLIVAAQEIIDLID